MGATAQILSSSQVAASPMAMEKMGVKLVKNPPDCVLHQLGVKSWPKYALLSFFFALFQPS